MGRVMGVPPVALDDGDVRRLCCSQLAAVVCAVNHSNLCLASTLYQLCSDTKLPLVKRNPEQQKQTQDGGTAHFWNVT